MNFFVNAELLQELVSELTDGHIKYGFGKKASFGTEPSAIKEIDCSGFVRYLMYHATDKQVVMPDGSWIQRDWCKKKGFQKVPYSSAANNDGWMRIAFMDPKGKLNGAGHVWFIYGGQTLESYGSKGPGRRSWSTNILQKEVDYCFKFARLYSMKLGPVTVTSAATQ